MPGGVYVLIGIFLLGMFVGRKSKK